MKYTFRGGVHPLGNKGQVEDKRTERFCVVKEVSVPMKQSIGAELEPVVRVGESVKAGQKLGESSSLMSVPVHSPISGKVKGIKEITGIKSVIIESDGKDEKFYYKPIEDYKSLSKEELLKVIRERGIVGLGGATFPTHIKLNPPKGIDTLIINGAECEPYLNNDNRLMQENPQDIIEGIKMAMHIVNAERAMIGIEENKPKAIEAMRKCIGKGSGVGVEVLKTKYPQGGEKQLIKALTKRTVPSQKLPSEVGVVVLNVHTVMSLYNGVVKGMPLTERLITVAGKGIANPRNLWVPIGTSFIEVLNYCGYNKSITEKLVLGGPLMGIAQESEDSVVVKGTTGLLALTEGEIRPEKREECISCAKCIDVCPMKLMPVIFERNYNKGKIEKNMEYNVMDCIECGACTFICPANRPLNKAIRLSKEKIRSLNK